MSYNFSLTNTYPKIEEINNWIYQANSSQDVPKAALNSSSDRNIQHEKIQDLFDYIIQQLEFFREIAKATLVCAHENDMPLNLENLSKYKKLISQEESSFNEGSSSKRTLSQQDGNTSISENFVIKKFKHNHSAEEHSKKRKFDEQDEHIDITWDSNSVDYEPIKSQKKEQKALLIDDFQKQVSAIKERFFTIIDKAVKPLQGEEKKINGNTAWQLKNKFIFSSKEYSALQPLSNAYQSYIHNRSKEFTNSNKWDYISGQFAAVVNEIDPSITQFLPPLDSSLVSKFTWNDVPDILFNEEHWLVRVIWFDLINQLGEDKKIKGTIAFQLKKKFEEMISENPNPLLSLSEFGQKYEKYIIEASTKNRHRNSWDLALKSFYLCIKNTSLVCKETLNVQDCNHSSKKNYRQLIWLQTERAIKKGFTVSGEHFHIDPEKTLTMQKSTKCFFEPPIVDPSSKDQYKTMFSITRGDTLDAFKQQKELGLNPVLLNMASQNHPGGGYRKGAGAQEENLFRRSNYLQGLDPFYNRYFEMKPYSVPEFGNIYTQDVQIFRGNEEQGYPFCSPYSASIIAVAAYNLKGERKLDESTYANGMKKKIRGLFQTAAYYGYNSVICSALGCGAFGNDPKNVAKYFREVCGEEPFRGVFQSIVFAILDDKNGENFAPFAEVFKDIAIISS